MHYAQFEIAFSPSAFELLSTASKFSILYAAAGFIHSLLFDREIIDPFTSKSCTKNEINQDEEQAQHNKRRENAEKIK